MIDTVLTVIWHGVLFVVACSFLVAGAAATASRLGQRRHDREQREHIEAVAQHVNGELGARVSGDPVIHDRQHPLYCHGARRGPEPPSQSLQGRFR